MKKSILYTSLGGFIVITFLIKIILSFSRYNDGYGTSLEIDEQALVFFVAGVCILIGGICGIYNSINHKSNTMTFILAFGTAGVILCGYFMGAGFKAIAKGKDGSTIWYDFIVAILGGFIIAGSTISYLDYKKNN
jgi:hypothetical protein